MKIPKVLIQTNNIEPPNYYKNMIKNFIPNWEYKFFNDEDIIEFIKNNPIEEFKDALEIFNNIEKGPHKADFFRYYYIYINGGVYLDYDALLNIDLDNVIKNYSFFCVKSLLNNNSMFNGFIGAEPKNIIIYEALKEFYYMDKNILKIDYFYICKNLYSIIDNYKNLLNSFLLNSEDIINIKCKIFNERLVRIGDGVRREFYDMFEIKKDTQKTDSSFTEVIDENNKIIATHYYDKSIITPNYHIPNRKLKNINELKIGITLDLPDTLVNLFCNGIRQNVIYLGELLLNIGYDTYFVINKTFNEDLLKNIFYDQRFKFIKHSKILSMDFDVLISIGYEVELDTLKMLKYSKTKIVSYNCGNNFIIDCETMLYNQHPKRQGHINYIKKNGHISYDIIWSIPQMTNTNQHYWSTLFRAKCIEVPFIWSDKAILLSQISNNKTYEDLLYKKRDNEKKLVIFEPNISIMKWCGPALLSCENAYRDISDKNKIRQVFINNVKDKEKDTSINSFNIDAFTRYVNNLDLCVDGKLSIESRFNTLTFMSVYADIAVSFQWENNLNYIYFDLAWMGWPIIHNASLCKDVGYYYSEFNYKEGGQKIIEAIENHDNNADDYLKRNRNAIDKYLPTNKELQNKYIELISDLFKEEENKQQTENENIILSINL